MTSNYISWPRDETENKKRLWKYLKFYITSYLPLVWSGVGKLTCSFICVDYGVKVCKKESLTRQMFPFVEN